MATKKIDHEQESERRIKRAFKRKGWSEVKANDSWAIFSIASIIRFMRAAAASTPSGAPPITSAWWSRMAGSHTIGGSSDP